MEPLKDRYDFPDKELDSLIGLVYSRTDLGSYENVRVMGSAKYAVCGKDGGQREGGYTVGPGKDTGGPGKDEAGGREEDVFLVRQTSEPFQAFRVAFMHEIMDGGLRYSIATRVWEPKEESSRTRRKKCRRGGMWKRGTAQQMRKQAEEKEQQRRKAEEESRHPAVHVQTVA